MKMLMHVSWEFKAGFCPYGISTKIAFAGQYLVTLVMTSIIILHEDGKILMFPRQTIFIAAMLTYIIINSHSLVSDERPEGPLVFSSPEPKAQGELL